MSELLQFFKDMRDNGYGLAEIAAQLGTSAIAEPVAGFAAMYDPVHGADAIREGMTYQPRTQAAQEYSQSVGNAAKAAIKPAMPIIDAWKQGVDIAGQYSPVIGAGLRTVPTAIGIAMCAKPALQAGRQVSKGLESMQGRMIANANAPRTLNVGYMGQRGTFAGINALTADKEALAKAQQMIAQGVDPEDVWQETGWGRGADGKWRFEINDKFDIMDDGKEIGSSLNYNNGTLSQLANGQIGVARGQQLLNHDDLYAAYPDFKNMEIRNAPDGLGFFDNNNTVGVNNRVLSGAVGGRDLGRTNSAHSVLLHELQHAIQQKEGFAKGGTPEQFKKTQLDLEKEKWASIVNQTVNDGESIDSVLSQLKKEVLDRGIDDSTYSHDDFNAVLTLIQSKEPKSLIDKWIKDGQIKHDPYESYQKLAGEVEARMVQNRMNLTPEQRRDTYPIIYGLINYRCPFFFF